MMHTFVGTKITKKKLSIVIKFHIMNYSRSIIMYHTHTTSAGSYLLWSVMAFFKEGSIEGGACPSIEAIRSFCSLYKEKGREGKERKNKERRKRDREYGRGMIHRKRNTFQLLQKFGITPNMKDNNIIIIIISITKQ